MITLYISYSHSDEKMKASLVLHLAPLARQNLFQILDDRISPGEDWQNVIAERFEKANIIIILVSPNYLASTYCMQIEAARAMERALNKEVRLIPVILKTCEWHSTGLGKFEALPKNAKPISNWSKRSDAYHGIVLAIKRMLDDQLWQPPQSPANDPSALLDESKTDPEPIYASNSMPKNELSVFISHSSRDAEIAKRLIALIRAALNLPSETIRCTSVNGFRLPAGITTDEILRKEIHHSKAFIVIITPTSIRSHYVLFELGARWGSQKPMIPLLASGASSKHLKGPLSAINVLNCNEAAQLHQFVDDLATVLQVSRDRVSSYQKHIDDIVAESKKENSV